VAKPTETVCEVAPAAAGSWERSIAEVRWSHQGSFAVKLEQRSSGPSFLGADDPRAVHKTVATLYSAKVPGKNGEVECCADGRCRGSTITDAAVSADERLLVLGGSAVCVYTLPELKLAFRHTRSEGAAGEGAADIALSPIGTNLVQAAGSSIDIWDVEPGGKLSVDPARDEPRIHLLEGVRVAFHPEGWEIASAGGHTTMSAATGGGDAPSAETITLWNVDNGKKISALRGNSTAVVKLRYSPSGKNLASLDRGGTLLLFHARRGTGVSVATQVSEFAFLSDDSIAVGTNRGEGLVIEVRENQPAAIEKIAALGEPVVNVGAAAGAVAIQGQSGHTVVWRRPGTCVETQVKGATRGGLTFLPDGSRLGLLPASGGPVWIETAPSGVSR
jgi:hypothetical protein